ncbi:hypothetical protein LTSEBAI_5207 [Salmonella enterica subsp. enterica serovar Baildon str. R6-199]|nr:hypothetical protein LTSEBAI_5207 [Salmonella enterica subsp. enterica serovar Baildon str. R6-199]
MNSASARKKSGKRLHEPLIAQKKRLHEPLIDAFWKILPN